MAKKRKESPKRPRAASRRRPRAVESPPNVGDKFSKRFAPPELYDPECRKAWKLGETEHDRGPYVIELNLQHIEGLTGAFATLEEIWKRVSTAGAATGARAARTRPAARRRGLEPISKAYVRCWMTVREWQRLLAEDEKRAERLAAGQPRPDTMRYRAIYKLWPDFPVHSHVYRSGGTIKADAALRSYASEGAGIVWAVIDSGIDGDHPHFALGENNHALRAPEVARLHRCYAAVSAPADAGIPLEPQALGDPDITSPDLPAADREQLIDEHVAQALRDDFGHGTHVAGIIAGRAPQEGEVRVLERVDAVSPQGELERGHFQDVRGVPAERLTGIAPRCRLISLRVLDENGDGRSSDVIRALEYVREHLNDNPKLLRVHGVNLSVGYEFDAEMFACGQSPICAAVNRLVQSGVVVVAAAGNTGYGTLAASVRATKVGLANTINDPGNAELAITVGATHRDAPHTYGVSYFSSKGPTGDGRLKPDLLAPGERITSCGAGHRLAEALESSGARGGARAVYVEDSGTSMAAPHVSGAIAAFLSIRREFIGNPQQVKQIFLSTATSLGRERYFEGHGLVDLIRAIQSV
jgi:subtilisin family serine protease